MPAVAERVRVGSYDYRQTLLFTLHSLHITAQMSMMQAARQFSEQISHRLTQMVPESPHGSRQQPQGGIQRSPSAATRISVHCKCWLNVVQGFKDDLKGQLLAHRMSPQIRVTTHRQPRRLSDSANRKLAPPSDSDPTCRSSFVGGIIPSAPDFAIAVPETREGIRISSSQRKAHCIAKRDNALSSGCVSASLRRCVPFS